MCLCLSCAPYWRPDSWLRHVPWLEIQLATLWFAGRRSIHWATPARAEHPYSWDIHKADSIKCKVLMNLDERYEWVFIVPLLQLFYRFEFFKTELLNTDSHTSKIPGIHCTTPFCIFTSKIMFIFINFAEINIRSFDQPTGHAQCWIFTLPLHVIYFFKAIVYAPSAGLLSYPLVWGRKYKPYPMRCRTN